jgi:integrase
MPCSSAMSVAPIPCDLSARTSRLFLFAVGALPSVGNDSDSMVVPEMIKEAPVINYRKAWDKIREEADLVNFRLHDLRHNFASTVINASTSLAVVGALLGHENIKATQRYAHLADSVVDSADNANAQATADKVAGTVGAA